MRAYDKINSQFSPDFLFSLLHILDRIMTPSKTSENTTKGMGFLIGYLYFLFFIMGFISELGAIGANLAVMLLELIFVFSYWFLFREHFKLRFSEQGRILVFIIAGWVIWTFISLIYASTPYSKTNYEINQSLFSLIRSLEYFSHIIFSYSFYLFVKHSNFKLEKLLLLIPITALLIAANLFFAWNLHPEIHAPDLWLDNLPFYMNIRQGGFHAAIGFFVLLGFIYHKHGEEIVKSAAIYSLACAMLIFLFWTGGRASVLALYLTLALWLLLLKFHQLKIRNLIAVIFFLSLISIYMSEVLSVMPWNGMGSAFERSSEAVNVERFSSGRIGMWQFSIDSIAINWLFGLGSDGYFLADNNPGAFQPHNSVLQFMMNWGVLGGSLAIIILCLVFKHAYTAYIVNPNRYSTFGFLTVITMSATSLVDGTLYHGQTCFYVAVAFACMFLGDLNAKNKSGEISA